MVLARRVRVGWAVPSFRLSTSQILAVGVAFAGGLALRLAGGERVTELSLPSWNPGVVIGALLIVAPAIWAGVIAHELGHAAVAWLLGLRVRSFGVGPVAIDLTGGRTRFQRNPFGAYASGHVFSTAGELPPALWMRASRWSTAAGPLAGSAAGLILLLTGSLLSIPAFLHGGLLLGGWVVLAINLVNLIPFRAGPLASDGLVLFHLLRGGKEAATGMMLSRWLDTLCSPLSPGSWPAELIEQQEAALAAAVKGAQEEIGIGLVAGQMLYLHYADRHEWTEAHHVITTAADLPRLVKRDPRGAPFDIVDLLYAIHLALRGGNGRGAQAMLDRIALGSWIRRNSLFPGAEAAIALAEQDLEDARALAQTALKLLAPSQASPGCDRLEASWWNEVIERASRLEAARREGHRLVLPATVPQAAARPAYFAWDPGVPPEQRALWLWRAPAAGGLNLLHGGR